MCNIIYFEKKTTSKLMPNELTILNVINNISFHTNSDGSGLYSSLDENIVKSKGPFGFNNWFGLDAGEFNLVHYRKATKGTNSYDNIHPFRKERGKVSVTMVHNGTVELPITLGGTDSESLLNTLFEAIEASYKDYSGEAPYSYLDASEVIAKTMEQIVGHYSVVLHLKIKQQSGLATQWTFYFRNSGRTAYTWETKNLWFLTTNKYEQLGTALPPRQEVKANTIYLVSNFTPGLKLLTTFTPKAATSQYTSNWMLEDGLWSMEGKAKGSAIKPTTSPSNMSTKTYQINDIYEFPEITEVMSNGEKISTSTIAIAVEEFSGHKQHYLICSLLHEKGSTLEDVFKKPGLHVSKRRMKFAMNVSTYYWLFEGEHGCIRQPITNLAKQRYENFLFFLLGAEETGEEHRLKDITTLVKEINDRHPDGTVVIDMVSLKAFGEEIDALEEQYMDWYSEQNAKLEDESYYKLEFNNTDLY